MSASQEKKRRQFERETGASKKETARLEESSKQRKRKLKYTLGTIISAVLIALILFLNSNVLYSGVKSIRIGDYRYTNAEFQYFYKEAFYIFSRSNQQYLSILLNPKLPLSKQKMSEGVTWADHFRKLAMQEMTTVTAIYDKAIKEGCTLSEDVKKELDSQMEDMSEMAKKYGYKNADGYLAAMYGKGVNVETVKKLIEMKTIATDYSKAQYEGFKYDSAKLKTTYAEHADEFDSFSYIYHMVEAEKLPAATEEKSEKAEQSGENKKAPYQKVTEETMKKAKQEAESIADEYNEKQAKSGIQSAELSEAAFREILANRQSGAELKEETGLSGSNIKAVEPAVYDKLTSDGAELYKAVVVEKEGSGYYVLLFLERSKNEYNTASFRHILTSAKDEDGNGKIEEAEINKAKEQSEAILSEFNAGDKSEESFAKLAEEKTDDPGSKSEGGLYENVSMGRMVKPINDFIFAPERKRGDTTIVTNSEGYSGSHVVYYSGSGKLYCDLLAEQLLRNEDYGKWEAEVTEGWEFKAKSLLFCFAEK